MFSIIKSRLKLFRFNNTTIYETIQEKTENVIFLAHFGGGTALALQTPISENINDSSWSFQKSA